jgi:hypothetical protein
MAELELDHNLDALAKHAGVENAKSVTAVNNSMAEVQYAMGLHWSAKARRVDALAGLIRTVTVLLVMLALGWSVFLWVRW